MMFDETSDSRGFLADKKMVVIGVGAIVAIVASVLMMIFSPKDTFKQDIQLLSARYEATIAIMNKNTTHIRNADLQKFNSEMLLTFASDGSTVTGLGSAYGDIPKEVKASETDAAASERLEKAVQLNSFDDEYKKFLSSKLTTSQALVRSAFDGTKSTSNKEALIIVNKNLTALTDRLRALDK